MVEAERRIAFRAEFSSQRCRSALFVNDYPVETSGGLFPVDSSAPATPWLVQGVNNLRLVLSPDPKVPGSVEEMSAHADLAVHTYGHLETQRRIARLSFDAASENVIGDSSPPGASADGRNGAARLERAADGSVVVSMSVELPHPIPRWAWLDSDIISHSPDSLDSLRAQYDELRQRVEERDSVWMAGRLTERTTEYRTALHAAAQDVPADYGVSELGRTGATFTYPIQWEDAQFHSYCGGRLVEFTRWDGRPLIVVDLPVGAQYLSFVFRRQNGAWVVAR